MVNKMTFQDKLQVHTKGRGFTDITSMLHPIVSRSGCKQGLCNLFIQHTSASLIVCENADPQVRRDLEHFMSQFVIDGDKLFKHDAEGPDDMPAHIRTILTQTSLTIPILHGQLELGTWQGIYLWEHRNAAFCRNVLITILN